ncbi:hypothetical protein KM043_001029 [Ampulex compressa]|nr:hypothetical protein KM043_001029 [Ampulex compressa]
MRDERTRRVYCLLECPPGSWAPGLGEQQRATFAGFIFNADIESFLLPGALYFILNSSSIDQKHLLYPIPALQSFRSPFRDLPTFLSPPERRPGIVESLKRNASQGGQRLGDAPGKFLPRAAMKRDSRGAARVYLRPGSGQAITRIDQREETSVNSPPFPLSTLSSPFAPPHAPLPGMKDEFLVVEKRGGLLLGAGCDLDHSQQNQTLQPHQHHPHQHYEEPQRRYQHYQFIDQH